jgi:hypothetical protein
VNWTPVYVSVKYRDDPVDVGAPYFESIGARSSSVVDAAWYDAGNEYLVIILNGTPYHYCSFPAVVWSSLKTAPSVGSFYANSIKGRFDCRIFPVPDY